MWFKSLKLKLKSFISSSFRLNYFIPPDIIWRQNCKERVQLLQWALAWISKFDATKLQSKSSTQIVTKMQRCRQSTTKVEAGNRSRTCDTSSDNDSSNESESSHHSSSSSSSSSSRSISRPKVHKLTKKRTTPRTGEITFHLIQFTPSSSYFKNIAVLFSWFKSWSEP
jgi:hypothetical protein